MKFLPLIALAGLLSACSDNNSSNPSSSPSATEPENSSVTTNSNSTNNAGMASPTASSITAGDGTAGTATAQGAAIIENRAAEGQTNLTNNAVPPAGTGSTSPTINSNNVAHPEQ